MAIKKNFNRFMRQNLRNSLGKLNRSNVILAFCLVAIGLLANPWLLCYLLQVSSISLQTKILIGIFEIFLIISGLLVYFKGNTARERKQLAFGYVALALVIILVEGGLHIIDYAVHRAEERAEVADNWVDRVLLISPYKGKEWASVYWKEMTEVIEGYEPFIGWRRREYHGEYVNVDSEGMRRTWNPENPGGQVTDTIYVFGGSTLWGVGARDDYTIPSSLSKLLDNNGYNFTVYNYGESAYVFKQELIHLILLLREGHRPDYVIFYDGFNEVFSAYSHGAIVGHIQVSNISKKLKETEVPQAEQPVLRLVLESIFPIFRERCMIYKAIDNMFTPIPPQPEFPEVASRYTDEELQLLSGGITEDYLESVELLIHLAQSFKFQYVCFWQPVVYTETKLTDEEATIDMRVNDRALGDLYRMTTDSLVAKSPPHFFDITDALRDRTKTYYIDMAHLAEEGNEAIAARMFRIFEKEFLQE